MHRPLLMLALVAALALAGCGSSGQDTAYQEVPGQPATLATDDGANQLAPSATATPSASVSPTPTATTGAATSSGSASASGGTADATTGSDAAAGTPSRSAGDSAGTDSGAGTTTTPDDARQADSGSQQALNDFCQQNPGAC